MIELVALLCSISNPAHCQHQSLTYSVSSVTVQQCLTGAQSQLAAWVRERGDDWSVRNYSCRRAGEFAKA